MIGSFGRVFSPRRQDSARFDVLQFGGETDDFPSRLRELDEDCDQQQQQEYCWRRDATEIACFNDREDRGDHGANPKRCANRECRAKDKKNGRHKFEERRYPAPPPWESVADEFFTDGFASGSVDNSSEEKGGSCGERRSICKRERYQVRHSETSRAAWPHWL
ncbi:hypothetical protein Atu4200 [Agrobacterium fabrum str. C58]|uniref:Uncharacterized protein n=1 Tax=Agrobacterium fabrum (strain C58 / ATCC 33970) TaxID=176299 RepID=Q7CUA7_AGRFC|nr:hypothetical protein Atu4200 [Agrobacterium fabrum str. C58]